MSQMRILLLWKSAPPAKVEMMVTEGRVQKERQKTACAEKGRRWVYMFDKKLMGTLNHC